MQGIVNNSWWGEQGLNLRPIGYACYYNFRCLFRVCSLDCLFIRQWRMPAVQSLHLIAVTTLARDYHLESGFPEFDRIYLPVTR